MRKVDVLLVFLSPFILLACHESFLLFIRCYRCAVRYYGLFGYPY
jgi:hypothetical protein